jgi:hypothetical protein
MKLIYSAIDHTAAEAALSSFEASFWGQKFPAIGQMWRRAWQSPPLLAIGRRRLRRRARCLLGMLHPQHQLDQFVLRQPLQITSIHNPMDSGISGDGKGVGNYTSSQVGKTTYRRCRRLCE